MRGVRAVLWCNGGFALAVSGATLNTAREAQHDVQPYQEPLLIARVRYKRVTVHSMDIHHAHRRTAGDQSEQIRSRRMEGACQRAPSQGTPRTSTCALGTNRYEPSHAGAKSGMCGRFAPALRPAGRRGGSKERTATPARPWAERLQWPRQRSRSGPGKRLES